MEWLIALGAFWFLCAVVFAYLCSVAPTDREIWGGDPDTMPLPPPKVASSFPPPSYID